MQQRQAMAFVEFAISTRELGKNKLVFCVV